MIYSSVDMLIGKTPVLKLNKIEKKLNINSGLFAKLELFNPGGSAKDRVAYAMILDAEKKGILKKDSVIIEPTSGNTGIGLAFVAIAKGYRAIIVMPETMSEERKILLKAYGAELVLTPGSEGMAGAIKEANKLAIKIPNSYIPDQFSNKVNAKAHYESTGPEIYSDLDGKIDIFVACVGTGGTITGVGEYLKEKNPCIKIVAVEPLESPVLSEGRAGAHGIQGIGAGFVPDVLNTKIYDEIITVSTDEALMYGKLMGKTEGILVGISSGAALCAAVKLSEREENKDKNIVILMPDTGERYLSTDMFKF